MTSSCWAFSSAMALMAPDWRICGIYLDELTPNIHITVVDKYTHSFAFSFSDFSEHSVKICATFGWKPGHGLYYLYLPVCLSVYLAASLSISLFPHQSVFHSVPLSAHQCGLPSHIGFALSIIDGGGIL